MDILDYWPFPFPPRQNQVTALRWLQEQDAKYLLLESPVGSGKSAIGMTYSHYLTHNDNPKKANGDSFILTPQRMLQAQYERSVEDIEEIDMASFYGRGNYRCNNHGTTCDIGKLIKPSCNDCPCDRARKHAQMASDTVLNYKLALLAFGYTDVFKPRELIIMDECHTLEQHLVDFDSVKVMHARCEKYRLPWKTCKTSEEFHNWLVTHYGPKLTELVEDMEAEVEILKERGDQLNQNQKRKIKEFESLEKHKDEVLILTLYKAETVMKEFVFTKDDKTQEFKRLFGRYSFHNILAHKAKRFLFMSSTILNKTGFCNDLGIPEDDAAFLSLPSDFPPENRKVLYAPQMKMNAKWREPDNEDDRQQMLATMAKICEMYKEHKGIIHSGNFQVADWLVKNLETDHHIYHHNPGSKKDRNVVIDQFQEHDGPAILISPSSTEGLDLKDDLGRFAIFTKIPFGYLGDQWIRRRMDLSKEWYQRRALIDVIQGGGRVVRSNEDWGDVFILDESWGYLYRTTQAMVPSWWKDGYNV